MLLQVAEYSLQMIRKACPIVNPLTLVYQCPICLHLFTMLHLVPTIVPMLFHVFTTCGTCTSIIQEVRHYRQPSNACPPTFHLFTLVWNVLPSSNNSTKAATSVYKLWNTTIKVSQKSTCMGQPLTLVHHLSICSHPTCTPTCMTPTSIHHPRVLVFPTGVRVLTCQRFAQRFNYRGKLWWWFDGHVLHLVNTCISLCTIVSTR